MSSTELGPIMHLSGPCCTGFALILSLSLSLVLLSRCVLCFLCQYLADFRPFFTAVAKFAVVYNFKSACNFAASTIGMHVTIVVGKQGPKTRRALNANSSQCEPVQCIVAALVLNAPDESKQKQVVPISVTDSCTGCICMQILMTELHCALWAESKAMQ